MFNMPPTPPTLARIVRYLSTGCCENKVRAKSRSTWHLSINNDYTNVIKPIKMTSNSKQQKQNSDRKMQNYFSKRIGRNGRLIKFGTEQNDDCAGIMHNIWSRSFFELLGRFNYYVITKYPRFGTPLRPSSFSIPLSLPPSNVQNVTWTPRSTTTTNFTNTPRHYSLRKQ